MKPSVLVTGCSEGGIGYHCAHRLREEGFRVLASVRDDAELTRLQQMGFGDDALLMDMHDRSSIASGVRRVTELTDGQLYGLFNNAGCALPGLVESLSREALEWQFSANLFGLHQLTTGLLPLMRHQGEGRIINHSSVLGLIPMPYRGAYNASKYALEGLSDTLRLELQGTNIAVSLLNTGPIISRFRENALRNFVRWIDYKNAPQYLDYSPVVKRLNEPVDLVNASVEQEKVFKALHHALTSPLPKAHYHITRQTKAVAVLKRILPVKLLDQILLRAE